MNLRYFFLVFFVSLSSFAESNLYLCETDFKSDENGRPSEVLLSLDGSSLTRIDYLKSGDSESVTLIGSNALGKNKADKSKCEVQSATDLTEDKDILIIFDCTSKKNPIQTVGTKAALYINYTQMRGTYTEVNYVLGHPITESFNFNECRSIN